MLPLFLSLIMTVVYNQQKIILLFKTVFSGLTIFINRSNGAKSFPELFSAYSCTDQDEAFNKDESENDDNTESESEEDSSEIDTESEEDTTEEDTSDNDTSEEDTSDVPISDTISTDEDNVSGDV